MQVRITGIEEIEDALTNAQRLRGFQHGLAAAGAVILADLKRYPPQRTGSTYRRTGTLGRSWAMMSRGNSVTIGTAVQYADEVQGEAQRHFHRETGWKTPQDVANARGNRITSLIMEGIRRDFD